MAKKKVLRDKSGKKVGEVTDGFSLVEGSRREIRDRSGKLTGTYKNEPTIFGGERTVYRNAKGTKRATSSTRRSSGGGGGGFSTGGGIGGDIGTGIGLVLLVIALAVGAAAFLCAGVGWVAWRPLFAGSRAPGEPSTFIEMFWPLAAGGAGVIAVVAGLVLLVRGMSGAGARVAACLLIIAGCLAYSRGGTLALDAVDKAYASDHTQTADSPGSDQSPSDTSPGNGTDLAPTTQPPAATTAAPQQAPTTAAPPVTAAETVPQTVFPLPTDPPPTTAPPLPAEVSLKELPHTSGDGYWASGVVNGSRLDPALLMDRPQCDADPAYHEEWNLGGSFRSFTATVGVGDMSMDQLNGVYEVLVDGRKAAGGEVVHGQPQTFTADVSGSSTLTINIRTTFCGLPSQNIGFIVLGNATVKR